MRRIVCALACSTLVFVTGPASAQEKGKVGITMGYPASVGVVWHVTDRVALRPEISIAHSWSESTFRLVFPLPFPSVPGFPSFPEIPPQTISTSSWTFTTGLTGLWYLWKADNVSAYLAPAVTYSRTSFDTETSGGSRVLYYDPDFNTRLIPGAGVEDYTSSDIGARAAVGIQYAPHRRFSIFGELGADYRRSLDDDVQYESFLDSSTKSASWRTRSAAGIIFYF